MQLTQSELVAPEHVPQAPSQGLQTLLLSAYLAMGRQEARHVPGALKKGCEEAHTTHIGLFLAQAESSVEALNA